MRDNLKKLLEHQINISLETTINANNIDNNKDIEKLRVPDPS